MQRQIEETTGVRRFTHRFRKGKYFIALRIYAWYHREARRRAARMVRRCATMDDVLLDVDDADIALHSRSLPAPLLRAAEPLAVAPFHVPAFNGFYDVMCERADGMIVVRYGDGRCIDRSIANPVLLMSRRLGYDMCGWLGRSFVRFGVLLS